MFSVQPLLNLFLNNSLPVISQNFLCLRLTQKVFVIAALFFFLLVRFSGRATKIFLATVLRLIIKREFDRDLTHSLDKLKNISVKNLPQVVIRDACGTWHGLCTVTSIHSMQKAQQIITNSETC